MRNKKRIKQKTEQKWVCDTCNNTFTAYTPITGAHCVKCNKPMRLNLGIIV